MSGEEQNKKKLKSDEMFGKINQFVTLQKDETANYNKIFTKVWYDNYLKIKILSTFN